MWGCVLWAESVPKQCVRKICSLVFNHSATSPFFFLKFGYGQIYYFKLRMKGLKIITMCFDDVENKFWQINYN